MNVYLTSLGKWTDWVQLSKTVLYKQENKKKITQYQPSKAFIHHKLPYQLSKIDQTEEWYYQLEPKSQYSVSSLLTIKREHRWFQGIPEQRRTYGKSVKLLDEEVARVRKEGGGQYQPSYGGLSGRKEIKEFMKECSIGKIKWKVITTLDFWCKEQNMDEEIQLVDFIGAL
ncbi:hypothetical protein P3S68_002086 [Capsicum galapagoense]